MGRLPAVVATVIGVVLLSCAAQAFAQDPPHRIPAGQAPTNIAEVQKELTARGYYSGPISGQINPATTVAIGLFQGDVGLPMTGVADQQVDKMLHVGTRHHGAAVAMIPPPAPEPPPPHPAPPPAPKLVAAPPAVPVDHSHDDPKALEAKTVRDLQELLAARGFYTGSVDGVPTLATATAFKAFSEGTMAALDPQAAAGHGQWPTGVLQHKPKPGEVATEEAVKPAEVPAPAAPPKVIAPPVTEAVAPQPTPAAAVAPVSTPHLPSEN
jgi:peptidoglycan hydrolase-like protein with peptidoglycan-binding domain